MRSAQTVKFGSLGFVGFCTTLLLLTLDKIAQTMEVDITTVNLSYSGIVKP